MIHVCKVVFSGVSGPQPSVLTVPHNATLCGRYFRCLLTGRVGSASAGRPEAAEVTFPHRVSFVIIPFEEFRRV